MRLRIVQLVVVSLLARWSLAAVLPAEDCDVLVVGGGPAGVAAALQSARAGAKTILLEQGFQVGGTMTTGGVNFPGLFHAWGRQVIDGIGYALVTNCVALAGDSLPDFTKPTGRKHYRHQITVSIPLYVALAEEALQSAGVVIHYHAAPTSVTRVGEAWSVSVSAVGDLRSIVSRQIVDCTGNATVTAMAGFRRVSDSNRQPGTFVYALDPGVDVNALDGEMLERRYAQALREGRVLKGDVRRGFLNFLRNRANTANYVADADNSTADLRTETNMRGRASMLRMYRFMRGIKCLEGVRVLSMSPEVGVRETYRIAAEYMISRDDYVSGRIFEDSLCYAFYPVDLHDDSTDVHPAHLPEGVVATVPLRALIPRGSRNLIVAGRCVGSDHEANSGLRVEAACMAMGQVAGEAAAQAARWNCSPLEVPLEVLRKQLVSTGAIVPVGFDATNRADSAALTPSGAAADALNHRIKDGSKGFEGRLHPTYPSVCDVKGTTARDVPAFLRSAVMYQLFTRMFTPEGTFRAAERKLPELKELGVDVIYLTPHQLADDDPDPRHWSARQKRSGFGNPKNPYRQKDFFAVDPEYGTAEDLKDFVGTAHRLGMKVMFDLVYFHCGPKAVFLGEHPEYVVRNADGTPRLGDWAFPEMDISRREVREYLYGNMQGFIRDYGADGFRCDVADMLPVDFWEEGYLRCKALKPDVFMMCEGLKGDDQRLAFDLSYGFYTQWAIVDLLKGKGPASLLRTSWEAQRRDFPAKFHWMRCFENHDFANLKPGEKRKEEAYGPALNAAMIATLFLMDGVPMLYNGQEIADAAPHSIYSNRMHGGWHVDWTKAGEPVAVERRALVRRLTVLRHAHPDLFDAPLVWLATDSPDRTYAFRRDLPEGPLTLAVNVSSAPVETTVDGQRLHLPAHGFVLR